MKPLQHLQHHVPVLSESLRLDRYIAEQLQLFTRSQAEKRELTVVCNGQTAKSSLKLLGGEFLELTWQDLPEPSFEPEDLNLDVLFENDTVIVVNKPRGMVVHPAHGNWSGTLVQGLLHRITDLSEAFDDESNSLRPGIVHRLDKDTSGVLIAAKNPQTLEALSAQFRERSTEKVYWAIVKSRPKTEQGQLTGWMARDPKNRQRFALRPEGEGKLATTDWKCWATNGRYSLLRFCPRTGRTHQLRVHSASLGCPILGDPIYSRTDPSFPDCPLMLHAAHLTLVLPGEETPTTFTAPLPHDFLEVLSRLGLPIPPSDAKG